MSSLYGNYRQVKFSDVWKDAEAFKGEYQASPLYDVTVTGTEPNQVTHYNNSLTDAATVQLFYLLYAKYGNSTVASSDTNQFKYKVWSTIYKYGPTWEKRLGIQNNLRELTEADILAGSKQINNHSYNPSTEPSTSSLTELTTINEQVTTSFKKNKLEGYALLTSLLEKDVTAEFIDKFKSFFLVIVEPEEALWYTTDEGDNV